MRTVQERVEDNTEYSELFDLGEVMIENLNEIEQALYQTRLESPQDPLNYPIRINDKLAGLKSLAAYGDHAPTESMLMVKTKLERESRALLDRFDEIENESIAEYNRKASSLNLSILPQE